MRVFSSLTEILAEAPAWVPLLLCPVLLLAAAAVLFFTDRTLFPAAAAVLGGAAGAMLLARDTGGGLVFLALYAAAAGGLRLLLRLPRPVRRKGKRETRDERVYRKFREELSEQPRPSVPPKVCCYETPEATATAEECGMRLKHAEALLERLKGAKLSAGDRLELDALSRTVDGARGRPLTEAELAVLNDCLASVLKLTAKYKI